MGTDLKALIRYSKWIVDEKRRALAELQGREDAIIAEQQALEAEIISEQKLAAQAAMEVGFIYGAFAVRCIQRREDLVRTLEDARVLVEQAQEELAEGFRQQKTYEITQSNRDLREREEVARRDQVALDEISLNLYRRNAEEDEENSPE